MQLKLDVFAQRPAQNPLQLGQELIQVHHLRSGRLTAGIIEQLADHLRASPRRRADLAQVPAQRVLCGQLAQGMFGESQNHGEHVVEVVRHSPGQPPHGLQFLGLQQLGLDRFVFLLDPLALADIAHDGGEILQPALAIAVAKDDLGDRDHPPIRPQQRGIPRPGAIPDRGRDALLEDHLGGPFRMELGNTQHRHIPVERVLIQELAVCEELNNATRIPHPRHPWRGQYRLQLRGKRQS